VLAGAVAFSIPYKYRSAATLKMDQPDSEGFLRVAEAAFTPQALSDIIRRVHLYANAPPEDSIDRVRRGIRVEPVAPSLAQVSFAYEDPVQARRVSQDLVDRIIEANLYVSSRGVNALQLVAPADQAKRQVEKKRYALAGFGLPTGMLLGVVLALILRPRATAAG